MAVDSREGMSAIFVLLPVFFLCIFILLARLFLKGYKSWRAGNYLKRVVPGMKAHWLTGHLSYKPFGGGLTWIKECSAKYPRGFLMSLGPFNDMNIFVINHPDHAQQLFTSLEGSTQKASPFYYFQPLLGDGIFLSYEEEWHKQRKLLTNCFHFNVLRDHIPIMNQVCDSMMEYINKVIDKGELLEGKKMFAIYTMDALLRTSFSTDQNCQETVSFMEELGTRLLGAVQLRWKLPWYSWEPSFNLTKLGRTFWKDAQTWHNIPLQILLERKEKIKNKKYVAKTDFLEIMLKAMERDGNGISEQLVLDEIKSFLGAGHDTTAKVATLFLYAIGGHPEVQEKCDKEIDELLDGREFNELTWEDMNKIPYLTMTLKETMRNYHSGAVGRTLKKPFKFDHFTLPAGTQVWWLSQAMCHNPTVWGEDHEKFDPLRFTKEKEFSMHPYKYTPFAAGQRNCIGKNFAMNLMKVFSGRLVREFKFEVVHAPKTQLGVKSVTDTDYLFKVTRRH